MAQEIDWSPSYCLACDRQTDTGAYCSEACRLAEYETFASPSSSPSWPQHNAHPFQLPSAYDFSQKSPSSVPVVRPATHARAHSQPLAPRQSTYMVPRQQPVQHRPLLTPSSSQSSLFSMQSAASSSVGGELVSEEARRELRGYASAFDQSRYGRRQSAS